MVDLSSGCSARGSAHLTYPSPSLSALLALTLSLTLVGAVGESQTSTSSSEELQFPEAYESPADALQEYILCRQCGSNVADSYNIENHSSPTATVYPNITIFGKSGVNVQTLVNPIGIQFKIITSTKSLCSGVGDWVRADSWFPGFLWKFCVCPHCSTHLGWLFEPTLTATADRSKPSKDGFYAIIVDNVIGENLVQSLMVLPSIYRS